MHEVQNSPVFLSARLKKHARLILYAADEAKIAISRFRRITFEIIRSICFEAHCEIVKVMGIVVLSIMASSFTRHSGPGSIPVYYSLSEPQVIINRKSRTHSNTRTFTVPTSLI